MVLSRFFNLIGKENTMLLRHVRIVRPAIAERPGKFRHCIDNFFVRHLSQFGMCDMSDCRPPAF